MYRRRPRGLAAALALATFATPLGAQSAARADVPAKVFALRDVPARPRPAALKSEYRIHLQSTWPQLAGATAACFNGGEETLDGVLTAKADGTYGGILERRTRLLFCGAHGAGATGECQLTLRGEGAVDVSALVLSDDASPSGRLARLTWLPSRGHRASVTGECAQSFKSAVEAMYLNAHHSVEMPLTVAGSAPVTVRLEDYAWTVSVE